MPLSHCKRRGPDARQENPGLARSDRGLALGDRPLRRASVRPLKIKHKRTSRRAGSPAGGLFPAGWCRPGMWAANARWHHGRTQKCDTCRRKPAICRKRCAERGCAKLLKSLDTIDRRKPSSQGRGRLSQVRNVRYRLFLGSAAQDAAEHRIKMLPEVSARSRVIN